MRARTYHYRSCTMVNQPKNVVASIHCNKLKTKRETTKIQENEPESTYWQLPESDRDEEEPVRFNNNASLCPPVSSNGVRQKKNTEWMNGAIVFTAHWHNSGFTSFSWKISFDFDQCMRVYTILRCMVHWIMISFLKCIIFFSDFSLSKSE